MTLAATVTAPAGFHPVTTCTPVEADLEALAYLNPKTIITVTTDRIGHDVPIEPGNVNDLYAATPLGAAVAAYVNINIADGLSMHITAREGEAIVQYLCSLT